MKNLAKKLAGTEKRLAIVSFPTDLGWMGLALRGAIVHQLKFGFHTEPQLLRSFETDFDDISTNTQLNKWKSCLQKYASGKRQDLSLIPIDLDSYPPFQKRVLESCRKIEYGQTLTYGQLAKRAGSVNAARAVGTAMKNNRYPLIVPCHRVVASSGIGGYSAASGVSLKQVLLRMEGVEI